MFLNGYDVSKNEATRGRLYRVRNAAGKTVRECLNIGHAIKVAESLPPGDVPDPDLPPSRQPLPVASPVPPEPLKDGEPLPDRWPPKPKPEPPKLDIATAVVDAVVDKPKPKAKRKQKPRRKAGK